MQFYIQQFKTVGNLEKSIFPLTSMVMPKTCKNNLTFSLNNCSIETHVLNENILFIAFKSFIYLSNDTRIVKIG